MDGQSRWITYQEFQNKISSIFIACASLELDLIWRLINKHLQLPCGDAQILSHQNNGNVSNMSNNVQGPRWECPQCRRTIWNQIIPIHPLWNQVMLSTMCIISNNKYICIYIYYIRFDWTWSIVYIHRHELQTTRSYHDLTSRWRVRLMLVIQAAWSRLTQHFFCIYRLKKNKLLVPNRNIRRFRVCRV